jgi:cyclohexanecarboxylate-CoA ligase
MTDVHPSETDTQVLGPHTAEQRERYYRDGWWQDRVLYDFVRDAATEYPERVAVTDGTSTVTYGRLREDALRIAAGLQTLGVKKGDRVAVQMPNWSEFALITAALSRLGAVLVPIMPIFRHQEVGYILQHSGAVVALTAATFHQFDYAQMYAELAAEAPDLRHVVLIRPDETPASARDFSSLLEDGEIADLEDRLGATGGPDDGCLVVYTSGTTSRPKGCHHTFNTIYSNARAMIRRLGIDRDDVVFCPSPVAHSTGLVTGVVLPILAGAAAHYQAEWQAGEGLERIERYGCTVTWTATTFLSTAMDAYRQKSRDVSSMRYWICAGAPIPGAVVQEARAMFPSMSVLSLYGRSENFATTMCGPDDPAERSVTSDGRVLDGGEIEVVDLQDQVVPVGEEGDLAYRGPSLMLGYYRNQEETDATYTPRGFSKSGDLVVQDPQGFIRVSGRVKDIIIRGGLNISAREVEDLLTGHPAVRAVAVVSMPDKRVGEKSCAFVVPEAGEELTLEAVKEYLLAQRVAVQKLPERLELVDALPMTAVGKVRKNVLREMIRERLREEGVLTS